MQTSSPPAANPANSIAAAALELGFCRVGFAPVEPLARSAAALADWLDAGRHGEMAYMATQPRRDAPEVVLAEAKTLIVVALAYPGGTAAATPDPSHGSIARYARGADYHGVLKEKLRALGARCVEILGRPLALRPCVDSAPLLERGYAQRAGVGFIAKSTMAIVPGIGTYVLLGELLVDVALSPSTPAVPKCGSCTRCLDACPTRAFVGPHVLDARKCISYLTIELRGPMPRDLRPLVGNMVFGCDICQEVCPFNASSKPRPTAPELAPRPDLAAPALTDLLHLGSAAYRKLVAGSAMRRVSRQQLARNAAVALGNSGNGAFVPDLVQALCTHRHALVRGHAAWALGRLGGDAARVALGNAAASDSDAWVREEATLALRELSETRR